MDKFASKKPRSTIVLSVLFISTKAPQVLAHLYSDWQNTGEYSISGVALNQLEELNEAMQFLANSLADELHQRREKLGDRANEKRLSGGI